MKKNKPASRLSSEESKNRILEATFKLLEKHGWKGTSFQMVADVCRISQSNVLYHFKSREALLQSLLEKIVANNFKIVSSGMRPELNAFQRIYVHFQKNLEWIKDFPNEAQVILLVYYEAAYDKHFAQLFRQILDRAQERILEYILAGIREKIFNPILEPPLLAAVLHNMLVGAAINLLSGRKTGVKDYKEGEWSKIIAIQLGYKKTI